MGHLFSLSLQPTLRVLRTAIGMLIAVCLAIGIGANVTLFTILSEVVGALPYPQAGRLVSISEVDRSKADVLAVNTGNLLDWRVRSRAFDILAHFGLSASVWQSEGHAETIVSALVAPELLEMLGASPALGRRFGPSEGEPGKRDVALVDYGFWQGRLGGSRQILGQKIRVDEKDYTIVGVLPSGFRLPLRYTLPQPVLYTPFVVTPPERGRGGRFLEVVGRLRPGVSLQQARQEMLSIAASLEQEHPKANQDKSVRLISLKDEVSGNSKVYLILLFSTSLILLIVVCINVGCLLLARSLARQQEFSIRFALGAGRFRLALEGMRESVALGLGGGLAGLLAAALATRLLKSALAGEIPRLETASLDSLVLVFAFALSFVVCIGCGIGPALVASRIAGETGLRAGRRTSKGIQKRGRFLLVASQSALLVVLLVASAAAVRTYWRATRVDLGFRPDNVLVTLSVLPRLDYREQARSLAFYESLSERLLSVPEIEGAAPAWGLPHEKSFTEPIQVPSKEGWKDDNAVVRLAGIGYFRILGISLLKGRLFGIEDRMGSPQVAIINQTMASRLPGPGGGIGMEVVIPSLGETPFRVVGVVNDVQTMATRAEKHFQIYVPFAQAPMNMAYVVMRTSAGPGGLVPLIRQKVWELDSSVPINEIATLEGELSELVKLPRQRMLLFSLFAAMALLACTLGVYGLSSFSVRQRFAEMGIRLALGARPREIFTNTLWEPLGAVLAGLAVGFLAAYALFLWVGNSLQDFLPPNISVYSSAGLLLLTSSLIAVYRPACLASRLDPASALRYE